MHFKIFIKNNKKSIKKNYFKTFQNILEIIYFSMKAILRKIFTFFSKLVYFTYIMVFRRIHKYMMRKYTKACEIERMILINNLKGLGKNLKKKL